MRVDWITRGSLVASLGPPRFAGEITELEVTLEAGDDDKGDPFSMRVAGERFADRTLHTQRLVLDPPMILDNQRAFTLHWLRGPGSGPRGPDSWKLQIVGWWLSITLA